VTAALSVDRAMRAFNRAEEHLSYARLRLMTNDADGAREQLRACVACLQESLGIIAVDASPEFPEFPYFNHSAEGDTES